MRKQPNRSLGDLIHWGPSKNKYVKFCSLADGIREKSRPDPWLGLMAISDFSDHTSRILGFENLQSFCQSLDDGVRCKKVAHLL